MFSIVDTLGISKITIFLLFLLFDGNECGLTFGSQSILLWEHKLEMQQIFKKQTGSFECQLGDYYVTITGKTYR